MKPILLFCTLSLALLCGCASLPGHTSKTEAMLDGERQVQISPGWLYGGGLSTPAKAGGFWTEKAPDVFGLEVVVVKKTEPITGLMLGIDGKILDFAPTDLPTKFSVVDGHTESSRRFVIPLAVVEELVAAKSAVFRIQMAGSFVEAKFFDQHTYALPAFRKALKQIQEIQKGSPAVDPASARR